jgi:DNA-directed RNA polymerase subunit A"
MKWERIPIAGVKHIEKAVLDTNRGDFIINTKGSNLKDVLKLEEVDQYRTVSNDLFEIQKVLGIEAARQAIITEYMETMKDNGININIRHAYLLADIMTSEARIKGAVRTGITGDKKSPFARASFEETIKHILNAAFNGEVENLEGIVENIIVGQPISAGTGVVKLTIDPKGFQKMIKLQEKAKK